MPTRYADGVPLFTVGHGPDDRARLAGRLVGASVGLVVDVRRFPGSRANPDVRREALEQWLPAAGVAYRWEERLGGRRHLRRDDPSPDTWWQVDAFRAYAAWTRGEEFRAALTALLTDARERRVAVMCSEPVWGRCPRRLIADVAVLAHGTEVGPLMPDGARRPHVVAPGARLAGPDEVV